jgi:hypothetical protein
MKRSPMRAGMMSMPVLLCAYSEMMDHLDLFL